MAKKCGDETEVPPPHITHICIYTENTLSSTLLLALEWGWSWRALTLHIALATATAEAIEAVDEVEHSVAAERVGLFDGAGHRRDALVDAATAIQEVVALEADGRLLPSEEAIGETSVQQDLILIVASGVAT